MCLQKTYYQNYLLNIIISLYLGSSPYPQPGQPQQPPYPYNSSNQTPYPPIPNTRQPGGQPPYGAPGGQSGQPPYSAPVYPPSLPYSSGKLFKASFFPKNVLIIFPLKNNLLKEKSLCIFVVHVITLHLQ